MQTSRHLQLSGFRLDMHTAIHGFLFSSMFARKRWVSLIFFPNLTWSTITFFTESEDCRIHSEGSVIIGPLYTTGLQEAAPRELGRVYEKPGNYKTFLPPETQVWRGKGRLTFKGTVFLCVLETFTERIRAKYIFVEFKMQLCWQKYIELLNTIKIFMSKTGCDISRRTLSCF